MEKTQKAKESKEAKPAKLSMTALIKEVLISGKGAKSFDDAVAKVVALAKERKLDKTFKGVPVEEANIKRQIKTLESDMTNKVAGWRGKYEVINDEKQGVYRFQLRKEFQKN